MQGQESVGEKEAFSADRLRQGWIILLPDSDEAWIQGQCACMNSGGSPLSMKRRRAENQVPKTQDVSCKLGPSHFTNRTEADTEKSLDYSFIRQAFSQGLPWPRYCFRYRGHNDVQT